METVPATSSATLEHVGNENTPSVYEEWLAEMAEVNPLRVEDLTDGLVRDVAISFPSSSRNLTLTSSRRLLSTPSKTTFAASPTPTLCPALASFASSTNSEKNYAPRSFIQDLFDCVSPHLKVHPILRQMS